MPAVFGLRYTLRSDSIALVSPDPENMGIAIGISLLLPCIEVKMRLITFIQPPSWLSDFWFLMTPLENIPLKTLL